MNYTRVPNDVAGALPRHRARSDAAVETEDVPPSTAYEQTAILNAAKKHGISGMQSGQIILEY